MIPCIGEAVNRCNFSNISIHSSGKKEADFKMREKKVFFYIVGTPTCKSCGQECSELCGQAWRESSWDFL
jgi:hypothetical protein